MAVEVSPVGERVRRLRANSNLSVRALAEQVGVTPSFIYQLEQGKVSASYSTLRSIAHALHTGVSSLTGDDVPSEWFIVRGQDRKRIVTDSGTMFELIGFMGARGKKMQPLFFSIEAGAEERDMLYTHEREDFLFVFTGELTITVGGREYRLQAGDSMYFMFDKPQSIKNTGVDTSTGIFVTSPPGV